MSLFKTISEKKAKGKVKTIYDEIKKVIAEFSPDVVAVSVLFSNFLDSAHNIARLVKQVNKKTKVILGGNHISNAVIDYGFSFDSQIGAMKQPNDIMNDWSEFFQKNRIEIVYDAICKADPLPKELNIKIEKLILQIKNIVRDYFNRKLLRPDTVRKTNRKVFR